MVQRIAALESLVVFLILALIACVGEARLTDWSAAIAVFFGFLYSQISFDIADEQAADLTSDPRLRKHRLFILKESIWIVTFGLLGSWPLLAGAVMFKAYP